jgi:hypothetical protein
MSWINDAEFISKLRKLFDVLVAGYACINISKDLHTYIYFITFPNRYFEINSFEFGHIQRII